jgi:hypothetical protein
MSPAFLRKLEYYEGILILTTNMIHSIDKAFRSRINVAVHYEELTFSQKKNLWNLFLSKLNPERVKMGELLKKVDEWAKMPFNGRQIRNVVLTAESLALGKSKYSEMDPDHIESELFFLSIFNVFEFLSGKLTVGYVQRLFRVRCSSTRRSIARRELVVCESGVCLEIGDEIYNA